jgi:hypothetical protein
VRPGTGPGAAQARAALGPLGMASAITAVAGAGLVTSTVQPGGWLLAWLALGLAAGYALSGSA